MADAAMEQGDKDGDGELSSDELDALPGLKYSLKQPDVDLNGDKKFSRDEIAARLQAYVDSKVSYVQFGAMVTYKGRDLPGAQILFVPEPFLGEVIPPAKGTTDPGGRTMMASEGQSDRIRIGMYKVEITSDRVKLPAKYNTKTTLGIEVSPFTDPELQGGMGAFKLR